MKLNIRQVAGFTLLPVILIMSLIAAIAFLLNRDNGMNANMVASQSDADRARYAAEAGLQAVNAKIQGIGCSGSYPVNLLSPVTNSNFGGASYYAYGNKAALPPDILYSTGTYNGTSVTLKRNNVIVYQSTPNTYTLQPNNNTGIDTFIEADKIDNHGIEAEMSIIPLTDYPLLKFNLSMFPAGSVPLKTTASFFATGISNNLNPASIYRMTNDWTEGDNTTGVNWTTHDGINPWAMPGGDFHPMAVAAVPDTLQDTWNNFDVTDLTTAWMLGRYPNHGIRVAADPGASGFKYNSSDHNTATDRPKLEFKYLLPCGTTGPSDATNTTVTLSATADSFNDSGATSANNGAAQSIKIYYTAARENRILVKFNTSSIPAGKTIQSATLRLFVSGVAGGTPTANVKSIMANALDEAWDEGAGNNTNKACPAVTVGTSWNYRTGCSNWAFIHPPNSAQAWTAMAPMPTARSGHAVATVNNKVYAIGGSGNGGVLDVVEEYNPATNTWTTKAPMPTARSGVAAAVVNGKIYVMGGSANLGSSVDHNEVYDPATNIWASKAFMPEKKKDAAATVANNKIYVFGGTKTNMSNPSATTLEYDPASDSWTNMADLRFARAWPAGGTLNDQIYAMGGWSGSNSLSRNEVSNPVSNSWSMNSVAQLPVASDSMASAVLGNKMFLISGYQGNTITNAVWMYDVISNAFSARTNYPASLALPAAAAVDGKIYSMGGKNGASYFNSHYRYNSGLPTPLATAAEESSGLSPLPAGFKNGWITLNLKSLVQEWVDGVRPNNGVVIYSNVGDQFSVNSRENSAKNPELNVTY